MIVAGEMQTNVVLTRRQGGLGRLTLNRPRVLNALSRPMIDAIAAQLDRWEHDPAVVAVLLDGAGERGLCAGGDIRGVLQAVQAGRAEEAMDFMAHEYRLNARISAYPKPYVAFMDGIVMGGGVGLSAHGLVRLVTPRSMVAMPETAIGMFPDVGGTFLLARAPGELGTFAALTARRFGPADTILLGLADMMVEADALPHLSDALAACRAPADVARAAEGFRAAPPAGVLEKQHSWIDRCFRHDSLEAILAALDEDAAPEAAAAARDVRRNSPTLLKVTLRALRHARAALDLGLCLERELTMAATALRSADFAEGVRAAVIDKNGKPRWAPARLADVGPAIVDSYFAGAGLTLFPQRSSADRPVDVPGPACDCSATLAVSREERHR